MVEISIQNCIQFCKENENQIAIIDKVFIDFDPDEDGNGGIEDAKC